MSKYIIIYDGNYEYNYFITEEKSSQKDALISFIKYIGIKLSYVPDKQFDELIQALNENDLIKMINQLSNFTIDKIGVYMPLYSANGKIQ